nr:GTPase IMAP family member 6-like [Misgurnus anguillicaudatus]
MWPLSTPRVDPEAQAEKLKVCETRDKQKTTLFEEIDALLEDKEETIASELLIVLLGMSGSGKSAARTMIFGQDERSQAGVSTATQKITKERGRLDRDQVSVLDTPDWFSSGFSMEQIKQNIQLISMCCSGPYAFLPVIPIKNEFTKEEREMVKNMERIFEEISWERVMILFIITDEQENQNIDQSSFLQHPYYQELVKKCGERFHLFSFSQIGNKAQLPELLEKIKKMVGGNVHDVCEEDENQTTSKTETANKTKDEREINYIQVQLPKSQRTVWISECPKNIKNPEVLII